VVEQKEDLLSANWIKNNSKPCPRCLMNIQKDKGCMHMTCRNCSYDFCWICLREWSKDRFTGRHHCDQSKQSVNQLRQAQSQIEEQSFYRDRFAQHWTALQYAMKKKRIILHNFRSIISFTEFPKDESFLIEVLDLLIDARRAISMTYAAGEYRKSVGQETDIFEMQQSLLWTVLDQLDKFTDPLEKEMKDILVDYIQGRVFLDEKFYAYKAELMHKAEAVTIACNALLKVIEEDNSHLTITEEEEKIEEVIEKQDSFATEESSLGEEWDCKVCTYQNQILCEKCQICDSINPLFL